jgi:uncharacterized protein (TIGR01777 family)
MPANRHILISGASGLLGSALAPVLRSAGYEVSPLRRTVSAPARGEATWNTETNRMHLDTLPALEAVVHLAGESVAQRWTARAKQRMWDSRCIGTRALVQALLERPTLPRVLLCASAIGYYGNRGAAWVDETAGRGEGFLAELTGEWEAAAEMACAAGMRVVYLRFGIVLAREGGALAKMLPAFRLGLAGRLGDGSQYWSWITRHDVIRAVRHALENQTVEGAVNVVAPNPVTNLEFTRTLGSVLHRPTWLTVPRFLIEGMLGPMGREVLLSSCRVRPGRLNATGFTFEQPNLHPALEELLGR